MDLEYKTEEEVMEFFRNRHGFMFVSQICDILVTHQNVQAQEIEEIKRQLHRLKAQGYLLVENEGQDIYQERFASTAERVENYFNQEGDNENDEFTQMSEEGLLRIIRRNENSDVPGSRYQHAVQELALRDRARSLERNNIKPKWWEKTWVQIIMVIGAIAGIIGVILFLI